MRIAGEWVSETLDYDGGRAVSVYLPPESPTTLVFGGDGELLSRWGAALEAAQRFATMIVGVHRAADEETRMFEYSPSLGPERFAAHEEFFVRDVREWVRTRFGIVLPPEHTAIAGVSAGGELALALGLGHPEIYGAIYCASPGAGYRPPATLSGPLVRTYLVAGSEEPFFLENAAHWASALSAAGGEVAFFEREGTHGGAFWRDDFPLMLKWAFDR